MTTNGTDLSKARMALRNSMIPVTTFTDGSPTTTLHLTDGALDAYDAAVRAQAPSLVLTDAAFCAAYRVFYETATGDADILEAEGRLLAFFRALLAERTSQAPSLLAVQRETWDAARDWIVGSAFLHRDVQDSWNRERDRRFPLSVEGVTLSDGSVVTYKGENGWMERVISEPNYSPPARLICSSDCWRDLLTEPTDTGADFAALKAYAAEQEAR